MAVMYWRDDLAEGAGLDVKALRSGNALVLAGKSHTYFDYYQAAGADADCEPLAVGGSLPLETVYDWRPLAPYPAALRPGVLGAQAQLWTDCIPTRRRLDHMACPRACALAQVLWTRESREDGDAFNRRLKTHLARLDRLGVAYRPPGNA